jgi:hypothetical protein
MIVQALRITRLPRRLRMDERNPPPVAADSGHGPDADRTVVYYGDAERVRKGFLLALTAMQACGNLLVADAALPAGNLNQEDK